MNPRIRRWLVLAALAVTAGAIGRIAAALAYGAPLTSILHW